MIIAGAGSGKTRAITYRIIHMIRDREIPAESILAITFTNKAAREMKDRVYQKLGYGESLPWVSTFHSFCLNILRKHIAELGYSSDFVIYDAQDQLSLLKKVMKAQGVNEDAFTPRSLLGQISGFKNELLTPEDVNPDEMSYGARMKAANLYPVYQKALREHNAVDFDDLLVLSVRLLNRFESIRKYYNQKYRHVMVDEFQDTNLAQYRLVQYLAGEDNNVCVVGDDDQSIYRWRGANLDNMLHFERDFPGTVVVKLEQNYRSTQAILGAAGAVVRENQNRNDKTLWTENETGDPVLYIRSEDEMDEARVVCEKIDHWNRESGISFNDIAVLYRTNAQSRPIEDHLRHLGVPYQVIGGLKFYERKEIKDVVAYMRVILNPADSISLKRIINLPARGIGKTTMDKLEAWSNEKGVPLIEALRRVESDGLVGTGPAKKITAFVVLVDHLREVYESGSVLDFLETILDRSGYMGMLEKDKSPESKSRQENLNELYNAVEEFVENEQKGTLMDFLDTTSLAADSDQLDDSRGVVALMTLHTCKGLEFDAVGIIGLENGLLPHASSLSTVEEYEEERRLCYVGFTRARKKLMVSNAKRRRIYGSTFNYAPSDFLMSIPPEFLHKEMSDQMMTASRQEQPRRWQDRSYDRAEEVTSIPTGASSDRHVSGGLSIGAKVLHPKFGNGVIVQREGNDDNLKVVVFFKSAGKKNLPSSTPT